MSILNKVLRGPQSWLDRRKEKDAPGGDRPPGPGVPGPLSATPRDQSPEAIPAWATPLPSSAASFAASSAIAQVLAGITARGGTQPPVSLGDTERGLPSSQPPPQPGVVAAPAETAKSPMAEDSLMALFAELGTDNEQLRNLARELEEIDIHQLSQECGEVASRLRKGARLSRSH